MRRRRTIGLATLASAGALIVAGLGASSAQAVSTFAFQFGTSGSGAGQFTTPNDIAVNRTTGDVYVTDRTLHRVSKFNAAGEFQLMWGEDVVSAGPGDTGTGFEICGTAVGEVCKPGVAGSASGSLSQPQGIGVDKNSGVVYVQDTGNIRVQKFDANGNFVLMWGEGVNETTGGDICTATSGNTCKAGVVAGNPGAEPPEPTPYGVFYGWHSSGANDNRPTLTVDKDGYVYVGECCSVPPVTLPGEREFPEGRVQKFDQNGNFVSVLAPPVGKGNEFGDSRSPAVSDTGQFYLRNEGFVIAAEGIVQFDSSAFTLEGEPEPQPSKIWGQVGFFTGELPVDVDPSNQFIVALETACALAPTGSGMRIVEYHPSSEEVDCTLVPTTPTIGQSKAIAVSGGNKLYVLVDGSPDRVIVFNTPVATAPEVVGEPESREITSTKAVIRDEVAANLDDTTTRIEYGTSPCFEIECQSSEESSSIGASYKPKRVQETIFGLQPDTDYYYRVVATNSAGSDTGSEGLFRTYPKPDIDTSCPNSLARQQTEASLLLDCRAYELVTPEEQGGYDVESDVVGGQTPFAGSPFADDRALFGIHNGGIPGIGKPTNRGIDPYVATREAENERWTTEYVGVPADAPSLEPFSSSLAGADAGLSSFAFGGPEICDPCFGDGSVGIPLRESDGTLGQGMVGSEPVADPVSAGEVRRHFSADGNHFIFGSEQQFEPEGNPENGNVTIYDRDLSAGTTQVVSTLPNGDTIENGDDVVALDVSADGSRVLIGDRVSEVEGASYFDLYMHVGSSANSVEVADTPSGVLYAGMTSDGSTVLFTTRDALTEAVEGDGDTSVDLFRADVPDAGTASLTRVSTGASGSGNHDACNPENNSYNEENWNVRPGGPTDCSIVAIGGGGGVARSNGNVYFLSPEELDGNGTPGAANLFLARASDDPQFVTTLESGGPAPAHSVINTLSPTPPLVRPQGAAFDQQDGSMYVYDLGSAGGFGGPGANVWKFNSAGDPVTTWGSSGRLTGGGSCGTLQSVANTAELAEFGLTEASPTQIAVDNSAASPSYGSLYVPSTNTLSGFNIRKFNSAGVCQSTVIISGELRFPGAIAVDQTSGKVYVGTVELFGSNTIKVFDGNQPNVATAPTSFEVSGFPMGIAVDGAANRVYVANGSAVQTYDATTGAFVSSLDSNPAFGVAVDPVDQHVFVDRGDRVIEYDVTGTQVGDPIGVGVLTESKSRNLTAFGGKLVVSNWGSGNALVFSPISVPAGRDHDSPLVIHSVSEPETRYTEDFQTTASGDHAVFPSVQALTGFDSGGKYQLFRYDAPADTLDCTSCVPTLQDPTTDASLASDGLNITDDGRVFFGTGEALVVRDTNGKRDVYEWNEGAQQLISSGQDRADSSLLTVSADGVDALFFTRDTFAANDKNGTVMKIYDAREIGGFFKIPPPPGCRASDECHGPGSAPPSPIALGTLKGRGGNVSRSCDSTSLSRNAKRLSRKAGSMRRRARRATGKQAAALRKKARRTASKAKRTEAAARRCRQQSRNRR